MTRLLLILLSLSACSGSVAIAPHFASDTSYVHAIPGCDAAPPVNCSQHATFGADGAAFVLLSDEANAGTYTLTKDHLDVAFTTHADGQAALSFTFEGTSADAIDEITNDTDGLVWQRAVLQ